MKLPGKKVLLKLNKAKETTAGGIILPKEKRVQNEGVIVTVGPLVEKLQVGSTVRFYARFGTELFVEGKKHLIVEADHIELVL